MQRMLIMLLSLGLVMAQPLLAEPNTTETTNAPTTDEKPQTNTNQNDKAPLSAISKTNRKASETDPELVSAAVELTEDHADDLKNLKKLLNSPTERAALKKQLDTLAKLKQIDERNRLKESQQNAKLRDGLLREVSSRLQALADDFRDLGKLLTDSPLLLNWLQQEFSEPESRQVWFSGVLDLLLVIGLGFVSLLLTGRVSNNVKRRLEAQHPANYWQKGLLHLTLPLLDLIPIAIFTGVSFVLLAVVEPDEVCRAIALAWINSSIITRSLLLLTHHLLRQEPVRWRLFTLGRTASLSRKSLQLLIPISVYGYFLLQLGLLLDMPLFIYNLLSFILLLLLVLLLNNSIRRQRRQVGSNINSSHSWFRRWFSQNWHWLAQAYLIALPLAWLFGNDLGLEWLLTGSVYSLLALFVYNMLSRTLDYLIQRRIITDNLRFEHQPSLKHRTERHLRISQYGIHLLMFSTLIGVLLEVWGFGLAAWLQTIQGKEISRISLTIITVISLSFFSWVLLSNMIESFLVAKDPSSNIAILAPRYRTLLGVARNALFITLLIVASLMVLSELGVNIAPLLAGAGVLGLAIGFGSQRLVQDMITGIFILLEDQVAVDDVIIAGGLTGKVEAISIRTLRLRDQEGRVHIIPFSAITTITNTTRDFSYFVFLIGVAYKENPEQVSDIIKEVGHNLMQDDEYKYKILEPIEVFGLESFGESSINIKGRIKTKAGEQGFVGRAFNQRLKQRFDDLGIEIPFPQRALHLVGNTTLLGSANEPAAESGTKPKTESRT